jgi:hypothetical protein
MTAQNIAVYKLFSVISNRNEDYHYILLSTQEEILMYINWFNQLISIYATYYNRIKS